MKRTFSFQIITFWLIITLPVLSGCANKNGQMGPIQAAVSGTEAEPETNQKLLTSIEKMIEEHRGKSYADHAFVRKMSLNFEPSVRNLTDHQKKVVELFFQTLPSNDSISIIVSIAPTSKENGFEDLHTSWLRVQGIKSLLQSYTPDIEELYQPSQEKDTVVVQVFGGKGV
ncbi:hypothetical protein GZ77_12995 [Endozoicomonas montiporae]|uniref:Uncharacterized protein n=2 Tax=Endozoicomonas montiporae TaxID=1027273 RepID=A0A081N4G0_9GAMM|nr:hypothetical protein [Endozoicomonas montiporae]AMO57815.1 hypothetical protein EZMO1_3873 [Endozoicomonas montiporae CL-33]KEQ13333.1 hypothetical protein GZ77_12995 [Endozoicomonas montiporae]